MRLRIRGPDGQSTVTLEDTATVEELLDNIRRATSLSLYDIKYGYPPQSLPLSQFDAKSKIKDIGVNLNGEQLIVSKREEPAQQPEPSFEQAKKEPAAPLSLTKKKSSIEDNAPEIPSPEHGGTIVLRVMPDDNSCLFRAVGSAVIGTIDTMTELRSIVAQSIQEQPDFYTAAVLEKAPDDYCRWIQTEDAWGGGIELGILSKHFDIEICSIDVQTLRIDRFNEGRPTRCVVVYSGIHYDTVALSPSDEPYTHAYAPPEFDTRIFDSSDPVILEKAIELCQILNEKHYYTDTTNFQVKCNVCGGLFVGEKGATAHASETGHYDFGEAGYSGGKD
ncbi:OTU-like cysteine protease [Trichophyton interdigitale]|uniref:Ubiquitin thioesterase OTU n=1 Tax=Trichophyton interdigitale TaxID=101480 RepID=A0A9P4YGD8_9EURO|nr:OTU-like cysteine protease [Trichophyton interdigitale]KAF3896368.1 OTU-like cysteine protease [Trichophyton interdigitale]KAG8207695.1 OTU-like cysteine protease [Trichophyton interdigitale]